MKNFFKNFLNRFVDLAIVAPGLYTLSLFDQVDRNPFTELVGFLIGIILWLIVSIICIVVF